MLDTICDVLKASYQLKWISSRDGNASYRRKNHNYLYVTPSGVRKQHLHSEMILKLDTKLDDSKYGISYTRVDDDYQNKLTGLKPTGELILHLLLQKRVKENRVVLHLHPTYIIAAMYAGIDLQEISRIFPEINRYTRVGPIVPEVPPISEELANETIKAFELNEEGDVKYDIIGLKQHGVVIIANDAWTAFEHCERLEHICQIVLASGKY
jgi:L-fuculose-phosphate aldolase